MSPPYSRKRCAIETQKAQHSSPAPPIAVQERRKIVPVLPRFVLEVLRAERLKSAARGVQGLPIAAWYAFSASRQWRIVLPVACVYLLVSSTL
jgi:hypothetical protein